MLWLKWTVARIKKQIIIGQIGQKLVYFEFLILKVNQKTISSVKCAFFIEICNHISVNIKIVVYWPIYDIEYWPIYEIFQKSFFDRYMSKFSFFDRYMKIFIFFKITIFGFYSLVGFIKTSYIGHYNNAYIGLYKNVYKTLGDLAYIDLYTPYRFAA